jgi:hypothetical protein
VLEGDFFKEKSKAVRFRKPYKETLPSSFSGDPPKGGEVQVH